MCTCSTPWYRMSRLMFCYICTIWATSRRYGHSLKKTGSHRWSLETGNPSPGVGEWRLYILTTFLACFRYISYEHNNIITGRSFYRFTRHYPEGFSLQYRLLLSTAATINNCMQCYYSIHTTYCMLYHIFIVLVQSIQRRRTSITLIEIPVTAIRHELNSPAWRRRYHGIKKCRRTSIWYELLYDVKYERASYLRSCMSVYMCTYIICAWDHSLAVS